MNIVRGAGIDGLAGMEADGAWPITAADIRAVAAHTPLELLRDGAAGGAAGRPEPGGSGDATLPRLLRPMLALDRAAVTAYLAARGIEARVDASNADRTFLRNRIRLDVLPLLEDVNPQVRSALTRLAATAADDRAFLAAATEANWAAIAATTPGGAIVLDAPALRGLHPALRRRAIRRAVAQLGGDVRELGHAHVNAIVEAVEAAVDAAIDGASPEAGRPGRTVLTLPGRIRLTVTAETATFGAERTAIHPRASAPNRYRWRCPARHACRAAGPCARRWTRGAARAAHRSPGRCRGPRRGSVAHRHRRRRRPRAVGGAGPARGRSAAAGGDGHGAQAAAGPLRRRQGAGGRAGPDGRSSSPARRSYGCRGCGRTRGSWRAARRGDGSS
ncbi:MAG: ATP-binding protein [Anaerolineae bacterium]